MKMLGQLTAYIVDDDEVELYVIQRILKLQNLADAVELYRSGDDLIDALKQSDKNPDFILLNYRMSEETGLEILQKIKALKLYEQNQAPYFILTSSTADLSDLDAIRNDRNIDGFLYKPLIAKTLQEMLKALFN